MAPFLFLMLALAATPTDPLDVAAANYQRVVSYRVTVRSRSGSSRETLRYFFKRPGFVRMEFIEPHNGAILVYNPRKKEARLRPFGFMKPLVLTLRPDNRLIISSGGHRVDASDFGAMLKTSRKLRDKGKSTTQGFDFVGGRKALLVAVEGAEGMSVEHNIHRCLLWLDAKTFLPVKTMTYNESGELLEEVVLDHPEVNIALPDTLFEP
jgi:hypothetical protein